jgi:cation transporter-like permease
MGTIGTRTSTTIHMPGIHMHITPPPQTIGTAEIGLTTAIIGIIVITVIKRYKTLKFAT